MNLMLEIGRQLLRTLESSVGFLRTGEMMDCSKVSWKTLDKRQVLMILVMIGNKLGTQLLISQVGSVSL